MAFYFQAAQEAAQQAVQSGWRLADWTNLAQIIEALFVVLSLITIVYQVIQQTKLAKASNSNTLFQLYAPFYTEIIKDEKMAELIVHGHERYPESKDEVFKYQYRASLAWRLTLQENLFYQEKNGLLDKDLFKSWEADFRSIVKRRKVGLLWPKLKDVYHSAFCEYVEKIIAEVDEAEEAKEGSEPNSSSEPGR